MRNAIALWINYPVCVNFIDCHSNNLCIAFLFKKFARGEISFCWQYWIRHASEWIHGYAPTTKGHGNRTGVLLGWQFSWVLYHFADKPLSSAILSFVGFLDGLLLLFVIIVMQAAPANSLPKELKPDTAPIYNIIVDPCIAFCSGVLAIANMSLGSLEPIIAVSIKDAITSPRGKQELYGYPPLSQIC